MKDMVSLHGEYSQNDANHTSFFIFDWILPTTKLLVVGIGPVEWRITCTFIAIEAGTVSSS